jgi:hypothetical protein
MKLKHFSFQNNSAESKYFDKGFQDLFLTFIWLRFFLGFNLAEK